MDKSPRFQWKLILVPFSWIYGLVVWIRNSLYDNGLLKSTGFNMPVISVGNITVGGTGKTPHTEYLAELRAETEAKLNLEKHKIQLIGARINYLATIGEL